MSQNNTSKLNTEINLSISILATLDLDLAENTDITLSPTNKNDLRRLKESLASMQDITQALAYSYSQIKQLIN